MRRKKKNTEKRFGAVAQLALERHQDTMAITAAATSAGTAANELNKYCRCAEKQQQQQRQQQQQQQRRQQHQQIKGRQKARDVRDV
ncbi:LOW QUALITY PROTEIN: nuclear transcription factor Y subunit beta [Drosophila biarmipes]|uniref:LOW QUALITY PROTEIN: nuclear transcription factor Y subunit beta n=1 Tax=Drosophila biarmipes TaxID=125945 RepID=UPI001CDAE1B9|nr:LOW QUALITY PROTEIN: nuclear transcription factor Y subunit beta [Drosophila biarmipes]